jgi:hypothetical protein
MPRILSALACLLISATPAAAQTLHAGAPIAAHRLSGPIAIDGTLNEPAWQDAARVTTWYEVQPSDNTPPALRNVGYVAYDDKALYVGFDFEDQAPRAIRAPLGDHDQVNGNSMDFGGVILDTRNDGHSGVELFVNPAGVQYDAVTDDQGGNEDASPDFFWEAAAHINEHGWTLELRVPFSSMRYRSADPQDWGILLFRNHPRDFRRQYFSAKLPRGGNCFVCRSNTLVGLERLPSGGHIVAAPYASANGTRTSSSTGEPLGTMRGDSQVGADVKWLSNADNAVDLTVQPDFSQVESDTAQISANERFALSFPEKRPFFLEGVSLFATPLQAVYTRTITSPRWGARATGKSHAVDYTVLVTDDRGGGLTVIPGTTSSDTATQAAESTVMIARAKRTIGRNFVGLLFTDRESRDGQGHSRLIGPDVLWRPTSSDTFAGQWLFTSSTAPTRSDLYSEWQGQHVSGPGAALSWNHDTRHLDAHGGGKWLGEGFRAETGFIPQVGYRSVNGGGGWTIRPTGLIRRERTFADIERLVDPHGSLVQQTSDIGLGMDTTLGGFIQLKYLDDRFSTPAGVLARRRAGFTFRFNPGRRLTQVQVDGTAGGDVDFANSRPAHGATLNATATLVPSDRFEVSLVANRRWLNVNTPDAVGRLFVARVARVRATWSFNAHSFVRVISQYVDTDRTAPLYISAVSSHTGSLTGSALFAYKLNWQSVLFVGYGDDREADTDRRLQPVGQQVFVKVSYALQR